MFPRSLTRVVTTSILIISISGCAYVIPPEQNAPRNNEVVGERRKPQLNVNMVGPQSAVTPHVRAMAASEPKMEAMNLPPVDTATQAQAQTEMANNAIMPPVKEARQVPLENQQFQVSSAEFPPINSVPPSPAMSGPGSAQERLEATKTTLEVDRTRALESKKALAIDAAAEPSMLSDLPKTSPVVPPNDPVQIAPVNAKEPYAITPAMPNAVIVPAPENIRRAPVTQKPESALPLPPVAAAPPEELAPRIVMPVQNATPAPPPAITFAPPPPMGARSVAAAVASAQPVPLAAPAAIQPPVVDPVASVQRPPIQLKQPPLEAPVFISQAPIPAAAPSRTLPPGDFDPLAVADNAPVSAPLPPVRSYGAAPSAYVSNIYIAPSRYAGRRY